MGMAKMRWDTQSTIQAELQHHNKHPDEHFPALPDEPIDGDAAIRAALKVSVKRVPVTG